MTKRLLTLLLVGFCLSVSANEPLKYLVVWAKDGTRAVHNLKEKPQVTFTPTGLVITKNGVQTVYPMDEMLRFTYEAKFPFTVVGDVNGDDVVNQTDVIGTASHTVGKTPVMFTPEAADVNKDEKVDAVDVTKIVDIAKKNKQ
jgi:hypothetical protein